jgi:hypothetical protein
MFRIALANLPFPLTPEDSVRLAVAAAAARANVSVSLGTERVVNDKLRITALVIERDGTALAPGWPPSRIPLSAHSRRNRNRKIMVAIRINQDAGLGMNI